jgi:hypothetical protein
MNREQAVMTTRNTDDARAELTQVSHAIAERRMELADAWRKAPTADRLLAVQRMLQEGGLPQDAVGRIEELHEVVRAAWAIVRADRKRTDEESRHRLLRAEMDLQIAENERDRYLSESRLEIELYRAAESFIMTTKYGPDRPPLKALLLKQRALELEVLSGMGAVDDDTRDDHSTKVVRILSALTWSGEGLPLN